MKIYKPKFPRVISAGASRQRGQGMVEFALILPLLLLLLLGVIEVGRMLVIYSSVQAASREAARYAAAAGDSPNGQPYYLNKPEIRNAGRRVLTLVGIPGGEVDSNDINCSNNAVGIYICYDHGPGSAVFQTSTASGIVLGDRVIVAVKAQYTPLWGLTSLRPFIIQATTRRTVVKEVPVTGFSNPGNSNSSTGSPPVVQITIPVNGQSFFEGDVINFSGTAIDAEDGSLTASLVWHADSTHIGDGGSFTNNSLPPGTYVIQAAVLDSDGNEGTAQISIVIKAKMPPVITLSSPLAGATFEIGQTVTFAGTATDDRDGNVTNLIQWNDNQNGLLYTGGTFTINTLSLGAHSTTASVTDSDGLTGSQTVNFTVVSNAPPTIQITAPGNGSHVTVNTAITFSAMASDTLDGDLSSTIVWKDENGNTLGTGATINVSNLVLGTHTITASVKDSANQTASATITIYVDPYQQPEIVITSPANNASFEVTKPITFVGKATKKPEGNDISNLIKWYVDGSGTASATGATFATSTLTVGTHTIKAEVTDSNNMTNWATITVIITAINNPPTVSIISIDTANNPPTGYKNSKAITFNGTASDPEDGDLTPVIKWYSSINGYLGQSGSFSTKPMTTTLTPGNHVITATVIDSKGLKANATQNITVKNYLLTCPTYNPPSFTKSGNDVLSLVWSLTVPGGMPLPETLRLLSLELQIGTLGSTGRVSKVEVDYLVNPGSANRDFTGNGVSTVQITSPFDILRSANRNAIAIRFTFSPVMNRKTDSSFTVRARFDGCGLLSGTVSP